MNRVHLAQGASPLQSHAQSYSSSENLVLPEQSLLLYSISTLISLTFWRLPRLLILWSLRKNCEFNTSSQMPFNSRAHFPALAWLRLVTLQPPERGINITICSFGEFSMGNPMSSKDRTFLGGGVVHSSPTQEEQQGPLACAASFPLALGEAIRYLLGSAFSLVECRCHPILRYLTDLNWRVNGLWGVL